MTTISYTEFCDYSLSKKIAFFDNEASSVVQSVEDSDLYKFLKQIILNITENTFVRRKAISTLVESVFLGKIKERQAITILIDEWENSQHIFLELQRIKDLLYFFDIEPEIQSIFIAYLSHDELEIVTEVQINLGFINFQKGFEAIGNDEKITFFQLANQYFIESYNSIENRIDAKFYGIVSSILLDLLNLKTANLETQLNQLSEILKEKWMYSFNFKDNVMDVSFFRMLSSITDMFKENPVNWIDYPKEFDKLYACYANIKNQEIKNRLYQSSLSKAFVEMSNETFIEPYFSLNFHSQIIKIDNCIQDYQKDSPQYDFLIRIKKIVEDKDFKKKVDTETIEQKFRNILPQRSEVEIKKTLSKIKDNQNGIEFLEAFIELNSKSSEHFIDTLISACLKLQSNRIYRGDFSEDDRNTYISDLLDSSGYPTKDQTRQGNSHGGKSAGEIDILIKDSRGLPFAIIEALNLNSVTKSYISTHIDKLFNNYDKAGFECNFILVYANPKKFSDFTDNYLKYVSMEHTYNYAYLGIKEFDTYRYSDLKIYKAEHIREDMKVFLYHIVINMSK